MVSLLLFQAKVDDRGQDEVPDHVDPSEVEARGWIEYKGSFSHQAFLLQPEENLLDHSVTEELTILSHLCQVGLVDDLYKCNSKQIQLLPRHLTVLL